MATFCCAPSTMFEASVAALLVVLTVNVEVPVPTGAAELSEMIERQP